MQHVPKETVNAWISQKKALDPSRLIPALVRYDRSVESNMGDSENEAIRYVEFCVKELKNREKAIHNYLISLYAKLKSNDLITYLELEGEVSNGFNWNFIGIFIFLPFKTGRRFCLL